MILWPVLVIVIVLLASLGLPAVLHPLLDRFGIVDIPNDRSSHSIPAVRGMGIAPMIALAAGGVLLAPAGLPPILLACMLTAVAAAIVGLAEDARGIPTQTRAILQLGVGVAGAVAIAVSAGDGYVWIPLGAAAIAVYINAANFMDGIDGISGLHGIVVGIVYASFGAVLGHDWLVAGGALLAVAFAGFLPWNVLRGRMFLGDSGSYLLGAFVAGLAFAGLVRGVNPVALTAPVSLYLADTGSTIYRRVRGGEPWLEAHRTHTYQRLTDRGFSHLQVATFVAGGSLASGLSGLLAISGSVPSIALSVALIGIVVTVYLQSARSSAGPGT